MRFQKKNNYIASLDRKKIENEKMKKKGAPKNRKKHSCIDGIRTHDPLGPSFFGGLDAKSSRLHFGGGIALFWLPKTGGGARPMCVSPPKRQVQSFPFPAHMKAEVMFT